MSCYRNACLGSLVSCLTFWVGCCTQPAGDGALARHEPETVRDRTDDKGMPPRGKAVQGHGREAPRDLLYPLDKICQRIYALKAWPEDVTEYTPKDWQQVIKLARILQRTGPVSVETALEIYVAHFDTAFEEGVEADTEWSKPYLLLRVMFELPEKEGPSAESVG